MFILFKDSKPVCFKEFSYICNFKYIYFPWYAYCLF